MGSAGAEVPVLFLCRAVQEAVSESIKAANAIAGMHQHLYFVIAPVCIAVCPRGSPWYSGFP